MTVLFDVTPVERALHPILAYSYPAIDLSPIIRLPNAASRAFRANQLATVLRDISETRDAVARLETCLEEVVFGLRQRRAAALTALAPVTGLPTEILREVFFLVADSDKTSKARIVLSHVSSSWRAVSLGFKELWTIIQVPHSCPDMVHEFARRSEDLRLELSTLSTSRWPDNLELSRSEISRLAVVIYTSVPPPPLRASFQSAQDHISLDECVLSGAFGRQHDLFGIYSSKSLELLNPSLSWSSLRRMTRLVSLTLANTDIDTVNNVFLYLDAPSLCELKFRNIEVSYVSDSDNEDGVCVPEEVELGEYEEQITALTIAECREQVLEHMCLSLNMSSLTSLSVAFDEHDTIAHGFMRLKDLVSLFVIAVLLCSDHPCGLAFDLSRAGALGPFCGNHS